MYGCVCCARPRSHLFTQKCRVPPEWHNQLFSSKSTLYLCERHLLVDISCMHLLWWLIMDFFLTDYWGAHFSGLHLVRSKRIKAAGHQCQQPGPASQGTASTAQQVVLVSSRAHHGRCREPHRALRRPSFGHWLWNWTSGIYSCWILPDSKVQDWYWRALALHLLLKTCTGTVYCLPNCHSIFAGLCQYLTSPAPCSIPSMKLIKALFSYFWCTWQVLGIHPVARCIDIAELIQKGDGLAGPALKNIPLTDLKVPKKSYPDVTFKQVCWPCRLLSHKVHSNLFFWHITCHVCESPCSWKWSGVCFTMQFFSCSVCQFVFSLVQKALTMSGASLHSNSIKLLERQSRNFLIRSLQGALPHQPLFGLLSFCFPLSRVVQFLWVPLEMGQFDLVVLALLDVASCPECE